MSRPEQQQQQQQQQRPPPRYEECVRVNMHDCNKCRLKGEERCVMGFQVCIQWLIILLQFLCLYFIINFFHTDENKWRR